MARRLGDTDLEPVTLAYLGASLVHDDRTAEGMMPLDETLAAVGRSVRAATREERFAGGAVPNVFHKPFGPI